MKKNAVCLKIVYLLKMIIPLHFRKVMLQIKIIDKYKKLVTIGNKASKFYFSIKFVNIQPSANESSNLSLFET